MCTHLKNISPRGIYVGLPEAIQRLLIRKPDKSLEIFRENTLWSTTYALLNCGSHYYGTFLNVNELPYHLEQIRMNVMGCPYISLERGSRMQILYLYECVYLHFTSSFQVDVRTSHHIIICNPLNSMKLDGDQGLSSSKRTKTHQV